MKKSVVLFVVLLALAIACTASADGFKVGYACNNFNDTFQTVIEKYAREYAEANGVEYVYADGHEDELKQQDQIKAMIEDGVNALVVVAVNPMGVDPIIDMAAEAGIPLVFVNRNPFSADDGSDIPDGVYYVGSNEIDAGMFQAQYVVDKIGADEVAKLLVETCGATDAQARACLELAELTAANGAELAEKFDALAAKHGIPTDSEAYALAHEGLSTLGMIVDQAAAIRPGSVIADLKIARGLDYYTGSVYETFLDGVASLGSICSGGRYDNLASQGNRKYPGVGLSIGLSRLVSYMLHTAGAHANRVSPASVLVAVWNESERAESNAIANALRARGIAADVAPTAAKLGKQIKYADKLGIPYVWFPGQEGAGDEVKNIVSGEQNPADRTSWEPDTVNARQTVVID